ncbi:Hvo_1808 family surface protein [Salinirubellus salinus]|uniref:Hvo_1808 family surface protein n=1 Tax=Salinirubellus salinus TaxID=1364945 RepID=A0A9E7R296_9EURY|nr:Hvo_1808 family surface protein [Salinirubellus salinus]UWM53919.1 Hvo_1808 family surface protein [Salinirubellus salinus]
MALVGLLLLAGCSVGYQGVGTDTTGPVTPGTTPTDDAGTPSPTPDPDRLGWEAGYDANATLAVNATDGLNESEREAVVARAMARVELIRGLEFEEPVPVEVVSREAYRERGVFESDGTDPVAEQAYEALFLVGEDRTTDEVLSELTGSGVVGYYSPGEGIVLVSDSPTPQVSRGTLAHELVHALQDQQLTLSYRAPTSDARLAGQGLVEGDAVTVEREYQARCGVDWNCIDRPSGGAPPAGAIARNPGVYLTLIQPYIEGPQFVATLRDRSDGGWDAVNEAFGDVPTSTEQVIHPDAYPEDDPTNLRVEDRSTADWQAVGNDTLGEAQVHVMFWKQRFVPRPDDAIRTNYDHRLSAGWGNDRLVAYRHAETNESAYVWRLVWDSPAEAAEFHEGYTRMLRLRLDAERRGGRTYVVPDGPFADAFRVTLDGDTVTVVNAPDVAALSEVGGE